MKIRIFFLSVFLSMALCNLTVRAQDGLSRRANIYKGGKIVTTVEFDRIGVSVNELPDTPDVLNMLEGIYVHADGKVYLGNTELEFKVPGDKEPKRISQIFDHDGDIYAVSIEQMYDPDDFRKYTAIINLWKNGEFVYQNSVDLPWSYYTGVAIDNNDIYSYGSYLEERYDGTYPCSFIQDKEGNIQLRTDVSGLAAFSVEDGVQTMVYLMSVSPTFSSNGLWLSRIGIAVLERDGQKFYIHPYDGAITNDIFATKTVNGKTYIAGNMETYVGGEERWNHQVYVAKDVSAYEKPEGALYIEGFDVDSEGNYYIVAKCSNEDLLKYALFKNGEKLYELPSFNLPYYNELSGSFYSKINVVGDDVYISVRITGYDEDNLTLTHAYLLKNGEIVYEEPEGMYIQTLIRK